jgi:spermidine synthase
MTLKVEEILHTEKSLYQDVLVFRSSTYGNVLILDGVIQCTERDEFSYQEMITHLPMASHPNPKNVLVIGGGDGGVIREVLKHDTVEHVTLCDIDEAVVRVSKEYLPHMSAIFKDPKVTVFIGDGFKFLPEHENEYDVIITDSSDPVGPAAALFEAPYFTLLKKALKEGGHMSTQGESLWLHLPLIKELRETTKRLFPVAEYAYTTIPTYPSGQIGFVCCSLDPERSVSTPLREVPGCKYYNSNVHRAAFVLPEFGRAMVEDGNLIQEDFAGVRPGMEKESNGSNKDKRVLVLGSGFVAAPAVEYIVKKGYQLTVGCRTIELAEKMVTAFPGANTVQVDATSPESLDKALKECDLVVSLIPYIHHAAVIESAIRNKKHVVTTSYVSPAMKALEDKCKEAGIVVMNEIGLDPGIDHVGAVKISEFISMSMARVLEWGTDGMLTVPTSVLYPQSTTFTRREARSSASSPCVVDSPRLLLPTTRSGTSSAGPPVVSSSLSETPECSTVTARSSPSRAKTSCPRPSLTRSPTRLTTSSATPTETLRRSGSSTTSPRRKRSRGGL